MVASFVAVFGLASVLVAISAIKRTATLIDAQAAAMHRARQQVETLLSYAYDDPEMAPGTHAIGGSPGGNYEVSTNTAFGTTKHLVVTMYWVDPRRGSTSTVSLASCVSAAMHR